jgi:hypothetical protein
MACRQGSFAAVTAANIAVNAWGPRRISRRASRGSIAGAKTTITAPDAEIVWRIGVWMLITSTVAIAGSGLRQPFAA